MTEPNTPDTSVTCSASRHVMAIADDLTRDGRCQHIADEPKHCAESMRAVVEALWAARREAQGLMQTLRDEIDENLRLRELGGARPDENITAMTERIIRELDQFRDAAKMVQPVGEVPMPDAVAYRHSNTHDLHDTFEDVQLADAESEAEPLLLGSDVRTYGEQCRAAGYAAGEAAGGKDAERLDWLSRQFVTVQIPLRFGTKACFTGFPVDGDGESEPWDIRAEIDAALRGEVK